MIRKTIAKTFHFFNQFICAKPLAAILVFFIEVNYLKMRQYAKIVANTLDFFKYIRYNISV